MSEVLFRITSRNLAQFSAPNASGLKLQLYPATGQFTLTDPLPGQPTQKVTRRVTFNGIMVNRDNFYGQGYFLLPELPDPKAPRPTTLTTSPIHSGSVSFDGR